jgi:hypothetical protein
MAGVPSFLRRLARYVAVVGAVLVVVDVAWTLGPGAGWVLRHVDGVRGLTGKELADSLDAVRGRALAVGTGLAALVAVYYTARNAGTAQRTFQLAEQGQVTERYTKAIEQLGSDKLDIRLGGIYALERIATDSARDHPTVMEVLTAFVREHTTTNHNPASAQAPVGGATPSSTPAETIVPSWPTADVQAAVTVIGRRMVSQDVHRLDLTGVTLIGANLTNAHLADARLIDADLAGAQLAGADLAGADLTGADLTNADLTSADLTYTDLTNAGLTGADLTNADLAGAIGTS